MPYADEDIIQWQPGFAGSATLIWDGSAHGIPPGADLDALDILSETPLEFSFSLDIPADLPVIGRVESGDVVNFVEGTGFTAIVFDASDAGIPARADLVAFSRRGDDEWFIGFDAPVIINAVLFQDHQLANWNPISETFSVTPALDAILSDLPEQTQIDACEARIQSLTFPESKARFWALFP